MDQRTGRVLGSIPGAASGGQVRAPAPAPGGRGQSVGARRGLSPAPSQQTPGKSPQVVDLTRHDPAGDGPAVKALRKNFPALSVTAKPQKTVPAAQAKRSELDAKVKSLLVHTPAKFTEWLIQQGLVRSEQYDQSGGGKVKLKLGMYSDGKKFPHSGGYVWIQEGQSNKYTSVFKGSIFESASNQAPTVMLKLLYHWSCQTNITNVANWVKVDNRRIDDFFQLMRSVCVCAVQDEITQLGAKGPVEVGVISLGTTTADGQKREVKVEVLGVLDRHSRQIRLRASEPIAGASQTERFSKIFEMLPIWVNFGTRILTDFSVDKETLNLLGYNKVSQCSLNQGMQATDGNGQIMEYLKKIVPKMFQNTLSNLSTAVIQQFLDELTFREQFANYPLACFDGIIQRISSQTSALADKDGSMLEQLSRVAADPFLDWRYSTKSLGLTHSVRSPTLNPSGRPSGSKSPKPASPAPAPAPDTDPAPATADEPSPTPASASDPAPATDPAAAQAPAPASASKRDADESESEAPSKTAKKSKTTADDADEGTSADAEQDGNSAKEPVIEGLPEDAAFPAQNLQNMVGEGAEEIKIQSVESVEDF